MIDVSARAALITHEMFIHAPNANEILERELRHFAAELLRDAGNNFPPITVSEREVSRFLERRAVAYREGK